MKARLLYSVLPAFLFFGNSHAQDFKDVAKYNSPDSTYMQMKASKLNKVLSFRHSKNIGKTSAVTGTSYRTAKITVDNTSRSTYTYDAKGNLLTKLYEHWANGAWMSFDKESYSYEMGTPLKESPLYGQPTNGFPTPIRLICIIIMVPMMFHISLLS